MRGPDNKTTAVFNTGSGLIFERLKRQKGTVGMGVFSNPEYAPDLDYVLNSPNKLDIIWTCKYPER
jgi:hypothetical protein